MYDKMIAKGKYVMTPEGAILFPNSFKHSDFRSLNVRSAGHFAIYKDRDDISVSAFGDSLTLGLSPDENDAARIKQCLTGHF